MFDLNSQIDETLLPRAEQIRRVHEQLDARKRDREALKLQFQQAVLLKDAARQTGLHAQADGMTGEIAVLEALLTKLIGETNVQN